MALTVNCFFNSEVASTKHPDRVAIIAWSYVWVHIEQCLKVNAHLFITMDVKQNIQRIVEQIDLLTKELFRLEGSLRVFQEMERNGILTVDVPEQQPTEPTETPKTV